MKLDTGNLKLGTGKLKPGTENVKLIGLANELGPDRSRLFIPYGSYGHSKGLQVFEKADATEMANSFDQDKPFYIGHPDAENLHDKYRDHSAYGWITGIDVGNEGMTLLVNWTEPGQKLLDNNQFKRWSPLWRCRQVGNVMRPARLRSAGLVHEPNMGLEIPNETPEQEETHTMKDALIKLLNLSNEATDEEVTTALQEKMQTLENEATALKEKVATLETSLTDKNEKVQELENEQTELQKQVMLANEARAELLLDNALSEGRITPAQKPAFKTKFAGNFVEAANELATTDSGMKTRSQTDGLKKRSSAQRSGQEQMIEAANEIMTAQNCSFNAAWAKAKAKNPALFNEQKGN